MITHDVIPPKDGEFDDFQDNLVSQVNTNQAIWSIPLTEINALQTKQTAWAAAWLIAKNKTNRTQSQVEAKDLARLEFETVLRPFIQKWIVRNTLMNDADLESCGINPRDTVRTPVGVPDTLPQVDLKPMTGHRMNIYFKQEPDEAGISRRGKPKGVAFCEFVYKVGDPAPASPEECTGRVLASRSPGKAQFEAAEAGQKVHFFARWLNTKGEGGPWTGIFSFIVP